MYFSGNSTTYNKLLGHLLSISTYEMIIDSACGITNYHLLEMSSS